MDIYTARLASFAVKSKRGTKSAKWPHPASFIANPSSLAEAGFYFDPSPEDPDNVTCYLCGKQLSEWGEEDDPFEIHYRKCQDKCAWAVVRCGIADEFDSDGFKFADKSRVPTSKAMEKARLETFKVRWQHDKVRGHGANSKIMAKAGFVHTPQDEDDDLAICLYCHVSLSGWDADDDPLYVGSSLWISF
ncbi:inhibitor of apoptosis repeat-containing protein [Mycena floridula]|nr:inhibitor of apoptosis repeat-containing protein [Mycena floridula]